LNKRLVAASRHPVVFWVSGFHGVALEIDAVVRRSLQKDSWALDQCEKRPQINWRH
jgi:hypothetical protein